MNNNIYGKICKLFAVYKIFSIINWLNEAKSSVLDENAVKAICFRMRSIRRGCISTAVVGSHAAVAI